jgi:hypothetical protein
MTIVGDGQTTKGVYPPTGTNVEALYYTNAAPATNEYDIWLTFNCASAINQIGAFLRVNTGAATFYRTAWNINTAKWDLYRFNAGTSTSLATAVGYTLTATHQYLLHFWVRNGRASGSAYLSAEITDLTAATATTNLFNAVVDTSPITATGTAALDFYNNGAASTTTTGLHAQEFKVTDVSNDVTIPVTDPNFYCSPYNWFSVGGSGAMQANNVKPTGTTGVRTTTVGYIKTSFNAPLYGIAALTVDVGSMVTGSVPSASFPIIKYSLDYGAFVVRQLLSTDLSIQIGSGLASGTHTLLIQVMALSQAYDLYTTPVEQVTINNLIVSAGSSGSVALTGNLAVRPNIALVLGDSITAGQQILSASYPAISGYDGGLAYSSMLQEILNAEVGAKGYGSTGFSVAASSQTGNVPALISSWSQYDNTNAMDTSIVPNYVIEMDGANDGSSITQSLVAAWLTAVRAVWPSVWIFSVNPPEVTTAASAKSAAVTAASDARMVYLNPLGHLSNMFQYPTPSWVAIDGLHPNYRTHGVLAGTIGQGIFTAINGPYVSTFIIGF